jgi:predicted anti-sigma-YlaC factor YlaD
MTVTCNELDVLLPEFLDGKLTADQETAAAEHLATCKACALEINELEGVTRLYKEYGSLTLPNDARERIIGALNLDE